MFNINKIFSRNGFILRSLLIGFFIMFSVFFPLHISHVTSYVSASSTSTLDHIQQKGELVVGTTGDMPPLNMTTKAGEIIGLEPDIAKLIASGMGVKLRFEKLPFSKLLETLENGKVDIILSEMTITAERNLKVAFVGPYFISGKSVLAKTEKIKSIKSISDLNNSETKVTALKGSTSQLFVETNMPNAKLITAVNYDEAVKKVIDGKVDALIAGYPICVVSTFRYPEEKLSALLPPITYEPIGIAMPPNDPQLINWFENFINSLHGSGKLKELKKKWFNNEGDWINKLP